MTAQEIVKALRCTEVYWDRKKCPSTCDESCPHFVAELEDMGKRFLEAADLIESLLKDVDSEHLAGAQAVAEVARLKSYCLKQAVEFGDRLEIVKAELAQVKRERDAAVESLRGICEECKYMPTVGFPCAKCDWNVNDEDAEDCWEWRGVQEGGAEDV